MTQPAVTITYQRLASPLAAPYRCELRDDHGLTVGLGYGHSEREAYRDARQDVWNGRVATLKAELQSFDAAYKAQQAEAQS